MSFDLLDDVEIKKNEFADIPQGEYQGTVTDVEFETDMSRTKISLTFDLTTEGFTKRKVWLNMVIKQEMSEQAKQITKQQICKLIGKDTTKGVDVQAEISNCRGNSYNLFIKPRVYMGKTNYNVYVNDLILGF